MYCKYVFYVVSFRSSFPVRGKWTRICDTLSRNASNYQDRVWIDLYWGFDCLLQPKYLLLPPPTGILFLCSTGASTTNVNMVPSSIYVLYVVFMRSFASEGCPKQTLRTVEGYTRFDVTHSLYESRQNVLRPSRCFVELE